MEYDTNELGKTPRMEDRYGPIARVPLCCGCEFGEFIPGYSGSSGYPPEPSEPGYTKCLLYGEEILEGQEPTVRCPLKEAADRSRNIAAQEDRLDAAERSEGATVRW